MFNRVSSIKNDSISTVGGHPKVGVAPPKSFFTSEYDDATAKDKSIITDLPQKDNEQNHQF